MLETCLKSRVNCETTKFERINIACLRRFVELLLLLLLLLLFQLIHLLLDSIQSVPKLSNAKILSQHCSRRVETFLHAQSIRNDVVNVYTR